jgi:hypothetical protein
MACSSVDAIEHDLDGVADHVGGRFWPLDRLGVLDPIAAWR